MKDRKSIPNEFAERGQRKPENNGHDLVSLTLIAYISLSTVLHRSSTNKYFSPSVGRTNRFTSSGVTLTTISTKDLQLLLVSKFLRLYQQVLCYWLGGNCLEYGISSHVFITEFSWSHSSVLSIPTFCTVLRPKTRTRTRIVWDVHAQISHAWTPEKNLCVKRFLTFFVLSPHNRWAHILEG